MNKEDRDYLRRKHRQLGDSYTCAFCRLWDGEGHEEVAYPCDVIVTLDELERWVKE
jgi:hypothetical protein